ncbi:hypothetical protein ACFQGT_05645 [Natrialbaceae archaeon GCM10025810]|uniref:hypothetical protein n=1 Tax=Halovalidus salilacus TaxID=3075124 RepID=UPI0036088CB1
MSHPVRDARQRIQNEHAAVLRAIDACADAIAGCWDGDRTTRREEVVDPLRTALESAGVLEDLSSVLASAVEATGHDLSAPPVAAPPYVVVTSCGPILRATIGSGRLVIRFDVFEIVPGTNVGEPTTYRRRDGVRVTVSLE